MAVPGRLGTCAPERARDGASAARDGQGFLLSTDASLFLFCFVCVKFFVCAIAKATLRARARVVPHVGAFVHPKGARQGARPGQSATGLGLGISLGTEARCSTDTPVLFQVSVCTDMGVYQVVSLEAQMHQVPSRTHVPIATPKSGPRAPKRCACGGDAWAWR
eukprot:1750188-Rhodomonas_salina.2